MFEKDSALAHQACKMVAFLDRKMPDFMPPRSLMLTGWTFSANHIKFTIEAG